MQLKHWLTSPVYVEDEEKTRQAKLLNTILLFGVGMGGLNVVLAMAADISRGFLIPNVVMLVLMIVFLVAMRRGRVRVVSVTLCIVTWLMIARGGFDTGGLTNPLLAAHAVVIVLAAMLINARTALVFGGLSMANVSVLLYLGTIGVFPTEVWRISALEIWSFYVTTFLAISMLLFLAVRDLTFALQTASYNRIVAEESHRELQIEIAERKRIQQEMHEAELLGIELQKEKDMLKMKESFISMVSHEFRTPLTVALSSQELLTRYYGRFTEEKRREYLFKIGDQIHHMVGMLDDILTLSKANAGMLEFNPAPLDLESFCRELFEEFQLSDGKRHTFRFISHNTWTLFEFDGKLLRHILLNLLSNATKYSAAGSEVLLEISQHNNRAQIQVRDHGIGIPLEDQPRLFEPFLRAQNAVDIQGTGLGLAIVKNSVEAHKGTVSFESRENNGTVFYVQIPLSPVFTM